MQVFAAKGYGYLEIRVTGIWSQGLQVFGAKGYGHLSERLRVFGNKEWSRGLRVFGTRITGIWS